MLGIKRFWKSRDKIQKNIQSSLCKIMDCSTYARNDNRDLSSQETLASWQSIILSLALRIFMSVWAFYHKAQIQESEKR